MMLMLPAPLFSSLFLAHEQHAGTRRNKEKTHHQQHRSRLLHQLTIILLAIAVWGGVWMYCWLFYTSTGRYDYSSSTSASEPPSSSSWGGMDQEHYWCTTASGSHNHKYRRLPCRMVLGSYQPQSNKGQGIVSVSVSALLIMMMWWVYYYGMVLVVGYCWL
jgi:predicted nucleic acid-binding Zn ribbon protein